MPTPETVGAKHMDWGYAAPPQATVLLVSVDFEVRDILQDALEFCGYQVVVIGTLQEAENVRQSLDFEALGAIIVGLHNTSVLQTLQDDALYLRWTLAYPRLPFLLLKHAGHSETLPVWYSDIRGVLAKPFAIDDLFDVMWTLLQRKQS